MDHTREWNRLLISLPSGPFASAFLLLNRVSSVQLSSTCDFSCFAVFCLMLIIKLAFSLDSAHYTIIEIHDFLFGPKATQHDEENFPQISAIHQHKESLIKLQLNEALKQLSLR
jgi:hypothetical protein